MSKDKPLNVVIASEITKKLDEMFKLEVEACLEYGNCPKLFIQEMFHESFSCDIMIDEISKIVKSHDVELSDESIKEFVLSYGKLFVSGL